MHELTVVLGARDVWSAKAHEGSVAMPWDRGSFYWNLDTYILIEERIMSVLNDQLSLARSYIPDVDQAKVL